MMLGSIRSESDQTTESLLSFPTDVTSSSAKQRIPDNLCIYSSICLLVSLVHHFQCTSQNPLSVASLVLALSGENKKENIGLPRICALLFHEVGRSQGDKNSFKKNGRFSSKHFWCAFKPQQPLLIKSTDPVCVCACCRPNTLAVLPSVVQA